MFKRRYVSIIQQKFQEIIGVQLLSSTFVVCFILYELSNAPVNSKYLQFVLYLTCMMTQVFFYCWYGNQLKLKVNFTEPSYLIKLKLLDYGL